MQFNYSTYQSAGSSHLEFSPSVWWQSQEHCSRGLLHAGGRHCGVFCLFLYACRHCHKQICSVFQAALADGTALKRFWLPQLQFLSSYILLLPKGTFVSLSIPSAGFSANLCSLRVNNVYGSICVGTGGAQSQWCQKHPYSYNTPIRQGNTVPLPVLLAENQCKENK